MVTAEKLNLRAGPGSDYEVVGSLTHGDALSTTGRNQTGDWLWVDTPAGRPGWVAAWLVDCDFDTRVLAVYIPAPRPTKAFPAKTAVATSLVAAPTQAPVTYQYLPAGPVRPDNSHPCPGCPKAPVYITGQIRDAAGNPLPAVRLVCYNDWYRYPVAVSKGDGWYDFPIIQATTTWYVAVLDGTDQPISPVAAVNFDMNVACWYCLDRQRTY